MIAPLVLPWSHVLFGSLIGPAVGVALLWLARERDPRVLAIAALGTVALTDRVPTARVST